MKKVTLFIFMCLCGAQSFAQKSTSTTIDKVTVFLNGAEIHHSATAKLDAGKSTITFSGLSPNMNAESVVIEMEPRTATILSVSSRINYLNPISDNPRIGVLKDSMTVMNDQISRLQSRISAYQKEKEILYRNESIGGTSAGVSVTEIQKAADFYYQRTVEISDDLWKLGKDLNEKQMVVNRMSLQLNELNAQFNPPTSEITLVVNSKQKAEGTFHIRYVVGTAGWAPKYDVRTENIGDPIQLVYRANVFNNSGLDWNDVRLTLSTAEPLMSAEKPKVEVWDVADKTSLESLSLSQVVIVSGLNSSTNRSDYFAKDGAVAMETIAVQELSTEFEIAEPYSIPTDSKPYLVDVKEYELPASYEHYALPKADRDAFLTAKVSGWNNLSLVSGKASIYFGGTYLGQSYINTASLDDTLSISLGRDKRVLVNSKKVVETSKRQVMGNNEKETFMYETTVRNNRDKPITIVVEDQLPISSSGEIVVDAIELGTGTVDKPTGKVQWRITLQPGESKQISFGYSIKTPKGRSYAKQKFRTISAPSF